MSYQVYVTRGEFWAENHGFEIPASEWLQIVEADDELRRNEQNGPYLADFIGPEGNNDQWIDWAEGNLFTGYPGRPLQKTLRRLATGLGAVVQGEDGEIYCDVDDFPAFDHQTGNSPGKMNRRPAYQRREIAWTLVMIIVIAAAISAVNVLDLW
jgi:hypothetical protein